METAHSDSPHIASPHIAATPGTSPKSVMFPVVMWRDESIFNLVSLRIAPSVTFSPFIQIIALIA